MDKILVLIFGAVIGSFLNVCIYRLPKGLSIVNPPSACPSCNKAIRWYDNVPVLSYVALLGRCRFCKARISLRYPVVEILACGLTIALFARFGVTTKFFAYALLGYGLTIATFVDFEINEIPDQVSLGGIMAGIVMSAAFPALFDSASRLAGIANSLLGALVGGASIYAMGFLGELVFRKEAMGGGDVKLMAMIGSFLGWRLTVLTFFVAPLFGAAVGLILKLKDGREIIPYGPYLSLAALMAVFYGKGILNIFFYGIF